MDLGWDFTQVIPGPWAASWGSDGPGAENSSINIPAPKAETTGFWVCSFLTSSVFVFTTFFPAWGAGNVSPSSPLSLLLSCYTKFLSQ
jgi:hypothetical protein